jgi:mRNA-degrading endonuclease toxin of MazEF toxin-antitoxin module
MLKQGSIVRARVVDPQGGNAKIRPLVIVSPTTEINSKQTLVAVAITGRFADPLAADEVALPYHPSGIATSGLRKPCVAKCAWLVELESEDVVERKGFLSNERLSAILQRISELGSRSNESN